MLLIDSLYINEGGALQLLRYLIRELEKRSVQFFLLGDKRCAEALAHVSQKEILKASLHNRKQFYKKNIHRFNAVLCLGNIPPQMRLDIPAYTYFHNINLLTLDQAKSIKNKILSWLKREVFRHYKNNTDYWLVQTTNTASVLKKKLHETDSRTKILPFYYIPGTLRTLSASREERKDYVFVGFDFNGAKGHYELLEAWRILHKQGIRQRLHLTVDKNNKIFTDKLDRLVQQGIDIVNHGPLPFEQVIQLYGKSKATVYPSHNESLGLGIIEAIEAGCDVIGADLPYTYSVCQPSEIFEPYDPKSIAEAVSRYENGKSPRSELQISNQIDQLIKLITSIPQQRDA